MEKGKVEISMKTIEFDLQYKCFNIYLNNNNHNKNFPSFVYSTEYRSWWLNDKCHNPYGWAVKRRNGYICDYLNGICYTKEQWEIERKKYL